MNNSRYIILDGINRCGKSTQLYILSKYVYDKSKKYDTIVVTREPTYGTYGKLVREILEKEKDPIASASKCLTYFLEDRVEHTKEISDYLKSDSIVLQDRGKYSTISFQGSQGLNMEDMVIMHKQNFIINQTKPNLVLILDITSDEAIRRLKLSRESPEKFEKLNFLDKVRSHFLNMKEYFPDENIQIINGMKSIEEVSKNIIEIVNPILPY